MKQYMLLVKENGGEWWKLHAEADDLVEFNELTLRLTYEKVSFMIAARLVPSILVDYCSVDYLNEEE
jgi:hypothetical protein